IWLSSADTAMPLIGKIYQYPFILQINELYDKYFIYRYFLKKISKYATSIVVPEYNRANIIQVWYKLDKLPFVLPNKSIVPGTEIQLNENLSEQLNRINKLKS